MTEIGKGTRVKCIFNGPWVGFDAGEFGPPFGSIWTIEQTIPNYGEIYLEFAEWMGHAFRSDCFRPLDGDAELAVLRSIALNPRGYVELPSREPAEAQS